MIKNFFSEGPLRLLIWSYRRTFFMVAGLSALCNILMIAPTLYMLNIFDRVMQSKSLLTLIAVTVLLVWFFLINALSEWMRSRILISAGLDFDRKISTIVLNAGFNANLNNDEYSSSEALSDLTHIRQFLTGNGILAILDLPWVPFYIFIAYLLHPILGALCIFFVVLQLAIAFFTNKFVKDPVEESIKAQRNDSKLIFAKLRNLDVIDAMGMHENLRRTWDKVHQLTLSTNTISTDVERIQQSVVKFVQYSMQSFNLAGAALLVVLGQLSIGAMVAANMVVSKALAPISMIVGTYKQFIQTKIGIFKIEALLKKYDIKPSIDNINSAVELKVISVSVQGLSAFTSNKTLIINDITFHLNPGEVVGLIGRSGSGKSTLLKCLVGVWPQLAGKILVNSVDLQSIDKKNLGQSIGYLPQDVELLEGTIAENICRFSEVDSEKIIQAAKIAGIHEMILKMPLGYDTLIRDNSGVFSGGQRQRIGIARAIYGDPAFLLFDEPNSNLDDIGEKSLISILNHLKSKNRTVILVTHKTNILSELDRLILMEKGSIVVQGKKDEVISFIEQGKSQAQEIV